MRSCRKACVSANNNSSANNSTHYSYNNSASNENNNNANNNDFWSTQNLRFNTRNSAFKLRTDSRFIGYVRVSKQISCTQRSVRKADSVASRSGKWRRKTTPSVNHCRLQNGWMSAMRVCALRKWHLRFRRTFMTPSAPALQDRPSCTLDKAIPHIVSTWPEPFLQTWPTSTPDPIA